MKRSERLVDMTKYLLERPHTLISLPFLQIVIMQLNHQSQKILQF